ncbi:MAG: hypothetical protein J6Q30_07930 [Oscillospiraceae bacterium]|nr:hypothetical protein [Oscillospiraceae bacterium]
MVCTFFGHRDCYSLDRAVLRNAIEDLIEQGAEDFLVGHQGRFDGMVHSCLKSLRGQYPHIRYSVVLAYLPTEKRVFEEFMDTVYPEGIEEIHPKYAIDWRNRYLIRQADVCLCYVNRAWGGAHKYACMAKCQGLRVINLGSAVL